MITIIAEFSVKSGCGEKFRELAVEAARASSKEKGNIAYNLYRQREDSSMFTFVEEWLNDEVIAKHNSSEHFQRFLNASKPLLSSEIKITQYTRIRSSCF